MRILQPPQNSYHCLLLSLVGLSVGLAACQKRPMTIPLTPPPTRTIPIATASPAPSLTPTPRPTRIPTDLPLPTEPPTPTPFPTLGAEWFVGGSSWGPGGYEYTLYFASEAATLPGECALAVTRGDGRQAEVIWMYTEDLDCTPIAWEQQVADIKTRNALGAAGYWSDINANSLPEFSVEHYTGCMLCDDSNTVWPAIYEIQDPATVADILVFDKPFEVQVLWHRLLHTDKPRTLTLYELFRYEVHSYVWAGWVYQWDGAHFVNVSAQYADEYRAQIAELAQALRPAYGKPLDFHNMGNLLKILVLTNGAQLPPAEGLQTFLEVSDLAHWPNTAGTATDEVWCWLQLARAQAQLDAEAGRPFAIFDYRNVAFAMLGPQPSSLQNLIAPYANRFEVSACPQ